MIYLDYAANTPMDQQVIECLTNASAEYIGNPNSHHYEGRKSRKAIKDATKSIASQLNVTEEEIIFTSGASEANNLAIKGIAETYKKYGKHMITTYLEHSSLIGAIMGLTNQGFEIDFVDLDENGQVDLDHLRELIRKDTILVSIGYVDSEIGIVQPIDKIAEITKAHEHCYLHVDATQAVGKIPVQFDDVDLVTFTAHKFYGPNGIGALIKKNGIELAPLIEGGLSTTAYRSGTPTTALICAMECALRLATENLEDKLAYVKSLKAQVQKELQSYDKVVINSTECSSPFILNFSLKGMKSREMTYQLDEAGIYVSTKSACCPENAVSKPVYAITKDRKLALNPVRISFSDRTTTEEIEEFLANFKRIYESLK